MKLGIRDIRNNFSDAVNRVAYGGERVVLERRGKGIAALVSMEDLKVLEELEDRIDLEEVRKARAEGGRPIPLEELEARLGIGSLAQSRSRRSRKK